MKTVSQILSGSHYKIRNLANRTKIIIFKIDLLVNTKQVIDIWITPILCSSVNMAQNPYLQCTKVLWLAVHLAVGYRVCMQLQFNRKKLWDSFSFYLFHHVFGVFALAFLAFFFQETKVKTCQFPPLRQGKQ
jgi:hypothetical protein